MDGSKAPAAANLPLSGAAGGRLALLATAFAGGGLAALSFAGRPDSLLLTVAAAFAGLGVCEAAVLVRRALAPADAPPPAADAGAGAAFAVTDDPLAVVEDGIRLVRSNAAYDRLFPGAVPQQALDLAPGGRAAVAQLLAAIAAGRPGTARLVDAEGGELSVAVLPLEAPRRVLWHLRRQAAARPAVAAAVDSPPVPAAEPVEAPATEAVLRLSRERVLEADESVCTLLGHPPGRFADGCPLADLVRPGHLARLKVVLAAARAPQTLAIDLIGHDGAFVPVQLRIAVEAPDEAVAVVLPKPAAAAGANAGEVGLFFQRAPLALARVDAQGAIRSANGAFDLLFGRAEGQGERMLPALVAERDRADLEAMLGQATAPGAAPGAVFCDVGLPGPGARSARLYGARLAEGASGDIALCAVDTTAQKALEAQFTQSQKMEAVGHLAGGVAHDFNNLLTAIIGFCDLLIARHRPSDPSFPDIMQIKQNANRAADLVGQLLAFSRRQTLRPNVTQLTDVISDVSAMLRRLIGERITLDVRHGRGLWPVKVDANKFEQVIVNLAVNARDAMPDGGTLTVRTMNVPAKASAGYGLPEADHVLVEVEDTGTGIPPELVDKIFEPFFTTKEVGKGTGLGLSTVYGIVQQTGGTLQVASEPGRGAIFRVFLPRHVGESTEGPPAPVVVDDKAHDLTGHGRVLLVEDEDAVRAFAARALSARGYEVILAASGVEALAAMDRLGGSVDLVVSDVVMPEMDGPTLLRELRARDPGLKFIFMSGYAEEAFARNLPQAESFSFLPKPFSLKDLVGTVATALKG